MNLPNHLNIAQALFSPAQQLPMDFREILQSWHSNWMWDHTTLIGPQTWIADAITTNTILAAIDGSYMRHLKPHTCVAAFILESTTGVGQFLDAIASSGPESNAYCGELLGLLAINLALQSVNKINPTLTGIITIYSNCMGAIRTIQDIPISCLPAKTKHTNILKTPLTYEGPLTITTWYQHLVKHQDNTTSLEQLSWPALLN